MLRLLDEYQVTASFCISLGPDLSVYPFSGLLPGWIRRRLPAPYIGRKQRDNLLAIQHAGHDIGLSSFSALEWYQEAAYQSKEWVSSEITRSVDSYVDLFATTPHFYGALGFQTNSKLFSEEAALGLAFATDVCGRNAFFPESEGVSSHCPQIPTTLPRLDELLLDPEINSSNLHQYLFAECQRVLPHGEVFTLSAEREGGELLDTLEKLIVMWKGAQWEIRSLSDLFKQIDSSQLRHHSIGWKKRATGDRYIAMQSGVVD
ncbi:MAG: hypothetical protein OQL20_09865 [Sedimenticola sp.]|nr:hypothetical protein [Sedimenticola sp.]